MTIQPGDTAPDFTLATDSGGEIMLSDLRGNKVILYFYPKDLTPGCTKESCDFRDALPDFKRIDAAIIGISRDSVDRHDRFKAKYELNFPLAADEEGAVCKAYGVWVEKSMCGRKYMGIERSTFLIDGEGVVRQLWRKVKVKGHAQDVLQQAGAL
ncbi:MAG: thioredoxin-dependent thiol peroxidase [Alphaproteobacteria bacterium]|jgi:peroxiredoxin Q/BCP|nr:thioredoxin-dependent thiol peroxidase [Rhodospirillaceae bacterium]MDP6031598.1 thioredoxin-dependent thiol peroxidase [Alphaproteobacteria bacterium]MDP7182353.1 thioredoxin-dependent thiol peroxidase [Alphaproteobacteria bacterium]HJO89018.1 thioredoxin-dependent thiol peroxidase [Alphaproteobacteria bacterium]|tara:strand:+ start:80 stop:544 length:465 start_codon:yes stop_codon:yes gene_type:complete